MRESYSQELAKLARAIDEAKQEINLARQQTTKHQHLGVRVRRAGVQAARAVAAAVDLGFLTVWPQGTWVLSSLRNPNDPDRKPAILKAGKFEAQILSMQFGSGCNPDGSLRDDTALALWIQSMCPVMRSKQIASKASAGAFDFPTAKLDEQGRVLGKDGKPLEAVEKSDPKTGAPAGWELQGPAAHVADDYDELDRIEHLRCQAADWADACEIAADLIRNESRTAESVNSLYPPPPDNWDGRVDSWPVAKYMGYVVDHVLLGPTPAWGNRMPIWSFDCVAVPGDKPSICPNAEPNRKPQPEWLHDIEKRFRSLELVGTGQTIHWVGSQSKPGNVCSCFRADAEVTNDAFSVEPGRWLTVTEAERVSDANRGVLSRAVDNGKLKGNGKSGTERRIDAVDLSRWILERSGKPEPKETNEAVGRKLRQVDEE